ncbi:MAG TPA: L-threonylcarbamoyladenylate synthase [Candidatus Krumholzibacteriaceae bacterium]|jgi:L-threonylcarbamoyladenylate synthase|nr:L-threonylcarbamoyladenylate synthase [Candidatus Krumholzibacteriaceae bacterium]
MKIFQSTAAAIKEAARIIAEGGIIVYPTDTVYGLGCNPFNEEAVRKIFRIKGKRTKPLPILASNVKEIEKIALTTDRTLKFAEKFWPGPLTMVLPKKPSLPSLVTRDLNSVAVRVPNHKVAFELIRTSGGLLVGTSANKTGKKPSRTAQEAAKQIGKKVDLIIDDGPTPIGASSTIIDLTQEELRIVRQGPIRLEDILSA